jgi:hypothetical protein
MTRFWKVLGLLSLYPAFGRLWVGRLVSLFGDAFTLIALPWFVLQVTGSGTATAGILLTRSVFQFWGNLPSEEERVIANEGRLSSQAIPTRMPKTDPLQ